MKLSRERMTFDLREELALLRAGLEEEKARHRATQAELEGIKNTTAYRLFKKTWAGSGTR